MDQSDTVKRANASRTIITHMSPNLLLDVEELLSWCVAVALDISYGNVVMFVVVTSLAPAKDEWCRRSMPTNASKAEENTLTILMGRAAPNVQNVRLRENVPAH